MEQATTTTLVLRNGPGTAEVAGTLALAATAQAQGHPVALVLLQDAVLCALAESQLDSARRLRQLLTARVPCSYL